MMRSTCLVMGDFRRLARGLGIELGDEECMQLAERYRQNPERTKFAVLVDFIREKGVKATKFDAKRLYFLFRKDVKGIIEQFCEFDIDEFIRCCAEVTGKNTRHIVQRAIVKYLVERKIMIDFKKLSGLLGVRKYDLIDIAKEFGYRSFELLQEEDEKKKKLVEVVSKYVKNMRVAIAIADYVMSEATQKEIADRYGITPATLRNNLRRIAWDHGCADNPAKVRVILRGMVDG